jgi:signal-transduction protein with cAMP-binding, CBS, and nucleotidyltransferase domain
MPVVGDLLSGREPLWLSAQASALAAARRMSEAKVKAVLVEKPNGDPNTLAGIFTEHDLMTRVVAAGLDPARVRLEQVLTREPYTVERGCKITEARRQIQERHISHLPVVERGRVVGMLSLHDVLRADLEEKAHEVAELEGYFLGGSEPVP